MTEDGLLLLSLIPPVLLLVDIIALFIQKRPEFPVPEAPRLQIWLQDMFVLSAMFVAAMAMRFNAANIWSAVIPLISVAFGFAIAVDVASSWTRLPAFRRLTLFVVIMSASIACVWLISMLWFLWNRSRARREHRRYVSVMSRNVAAFATMVYALSFLLPMLGNSGYGNKNTPGFVAYFVCFAELFKADPSPSSDAPMFAWFANPCFWISIAFLLEGRRLASAIAAGIAVGFALSINDSSEYSLFNSPGFAVWTFSMVLVAIFAVLLEYKDYGAKHSRANL
ncbi:MAG: hypothetical protein WCT04_22870 [Planctomycetota bacterium]